MAPDRIDIRIPGLTKTIVGELALVAATGVALALARTGTSFIVWGLNRALGDRREHHD
jgi:hypothetical protein